MARPTEIDMIRWFETFIRENKSGKRLQKNGKRVSKTSIDNYSFILEYLKEYKVKAGIPLKINIQVNRTSAQNKATALYYKDFYFRFSRFMADEKQNYDNTIGSIWKLIRSFFNWLQHDKMFSVGSFHKSFYAPMEKVPLITLTPERLQFLLYNAEFQKALIPSHKRTLDIFLVGCATGLRFGDLIQLRRDQLSFIEKQAFLKNVSRKTGTPTFHKLPDFAAHILAKKHSRSIIQVFTPISLSRFNIHLKAIAELAGWTEEIPKYRSKQGQRTTIYRNAERKTHYRFCDLISSHTMRRTTITTLLCMGMSEMSVRAISGHAGNSKEFHRYVNFAQAYLDQEVETAFNKLKNIQNPLPI